ncbi:hypothetical protein [Streptomyces camponoticapitis]|nr:hypothetical protein [Streptomyces camponoticapitis]
MGDGAVGAGQVARVGVPALRDLTAAGGAGTSRIAGNDRRFVA